MSHLSSQPTETTPENPSQSTRSAGSAWARKKRFADVLGRLMAYIERGEEYPIVFLHGNPTSSFLWRGVLPHVEHSGRQLIAPTQLEESYAALKWVAARAAEFGADGNRIAIAGNSGGNMAAALTLMAKDRKGPKVAYQVLLIPATDASVDKDSYHEFATGALLGARLHEIWVGSVCS